MATLIERVGLGLRRLIYERTWRDLSLEEVVRGFGTPEKVHDYMRVVFRYTSDREQFRVDELWQTPADMWARKRGDCEEFALMKALMLAWLGIDAWFVLCRDRQTGEDHAVAFVDAAQCGRTEGARQAGGFLVLDRNPPFHRVWLKQRWEKLGIYDFDPEHQYPIKAAV